MRQLPPNTFASESVTEGHPDKVCDQISDAILDAIMAGNTGRDLTAARVACETLVSTDLVVVTGEITTSFMPEYEKIIRNVLRDIGYTEKAAGMDANRCRIMIAVDPQSPDIAAGTGGEDPGAGDQGMMFGYACDETPELMPLPIHMAHKLTRKMAEVRKSGEIEYLGPDGKSQVTVSYDGGAKIVRAVLAAQHKIKDLPLKKIKADLTEKVVKPIIAERPEIWDKLDLEEDLIVNGTSDPNGMSTFFVGGPEGDAGLTGRKIIVDTYGGKGRHGGGAFSGKDPTKVDRSANYMCRYVAKNIVAAGLATECEFHLAYAIGLKEPMSVGVNTFGTGKLGDMKLARVCREVFSFRPADIIRTLDLRRPIYRQTSAYGHFGREEPGFTWEKTDKVDDLKKAAGME
ncbi:MAG TPA: methionine adenosyltransferase [bacterium]|nr:methionine adenosyltransferase [bacterium]HPO07759.1 methionine adenosyltransferase [bacterium]HQP97452.1 methionine adenosyltransferase [bacterium]